MTRPFYLIGHNTNTIGEIRRGLENGLNAFELDIHKDQHDQLYVVHDPVNTAVNVRNYVLPPRTEPFFKEFKALIRSSTATPIAMIILDCKFVDSKLGLKLLNEVRTCLTDQGTSIPVIFSVPTRDLARSVFSEIQGILTDKEGLMIDQESDATEVAQYFAERNVTRACYGDGLTTIPVLGIGLPTPNLPSEFDLAVALKALGLLRWVYPWVLIQADTMREFIRIGVDGILVDVGVGASTLAGVVAEKEFAPKIHRALPQDDPFSKSLSPVTLEVVTGDVANGGTDSQVTLTIERKDGTKATRKIDGDRAGRFERGTSTHVTLMDLDLQIENIKSIAAKQDGSGIASDWFLEQINLRQLGKQPRSCRFHKWILKGKLIRQPCS